MNIPKIRYRFRFLIKLDWDGQELKFNKIAGILNQLGIEDSGSLEDLLRHFSENLEWTLGEPMRILGKLDVIVWRKQAYFSVFLFRPFYLEGLVKYWFDGNFDKKLEFLHEPKDLITNFRRQLELNFGYLRSLRWSSEYGYRTNLKNLVLSTDQLRGTFYSYAARKEMLGRKVNFRRKVKKKSMVEY